MFGGILLKGRPQMGLTITTVSNAQARQDDHPAARHYGVGPRGLPPPARPRGTSKLVCLTGTVVVHACYTTSRYHDAGLSMGTTPAGGFALKGKASRAIRDGIATSASRGQDDDGTPKKPYTRGVSGSVVLAAYTGYGPHGLVYTQSVS